MDEQGTRRPDGTKPHELAPGEYAFNETKTRLWGHIPEPVGDEDAGFALFSCDERWKIVEEDDGTITAAPLTPGAAHSILIKAPPDNREIWHGWLVRGRFTTTHPGM